MPLSPNPPPSKPYRSPLSNSWYTDAIFYERAINNVVADRKFDPVFTLIDERPGYICFRTTFIKLMDPTGYKWAMKYLGDYEHWNRLMTKCTWFQAAYSRAMEEMKVKIRSEALVRIQEIANGEQGAQALVASKYLAGFEWENSGRGRPSKVEVAGELKRQAALLTEEDMDAERIGLKVVK